MMSNSLPPADVLSLPGLLLTLRRHFKKVLATFLLMVTVTVLYVTNRGREYESAAKLFVRVGRETVSVDPTAEASGQLLSVTDTQEREIRSVVSLLSNRDLLEQVVDELGPKTILEFSDPNLPATESSIKKLAKPMVTATKSTLVELGILEVISEREQAIQFVRDSLAVEAGDSSAVIKVSVRTYSPKLAQLIVTKLIDLHLAYHMQANSTPGSLPFFSAQTDRLRNDLQSASKQLATVKNETRVSSLSSKQQSLESRMLSLSEQLSQARTGLASSTSTVAALQQQLGDESELIPSGETVGMANSAKAAMREELYRLQILESELLAKTKEKHPKITQIRDQIQKARSVFDEEEQQVQTTNAINDVYRQLRISLLLELANQAALEAKLSALVLEQDALHEEIERVNSGELKIVNLQREVDLLDVNYRHYVESFEQVRIQKELESQQISNVNVAQKPSYVDYPVGPGNLLLLALGLIASICGACGVAMLSESMTPGDVYIRYSGARYRAPEPLDVEEPALDSVEA
jgi:uncharacterized protein involved in exopolysaccharide biosynthesis